MENNLKENLKIEKEQLIVLSNKKNLSITGTNKIISLKPDLIQLDTNFGGLIIVGENLELIKLDNATTHAEISGNIFELKYVEQKVKENLFRKIFK
jgi:sporulation protein YabP